MIIIFNIVASLELKKFSVLNTAFISTSYQSKISKGNNYFVRVTLYIKL